MDPSIYILCPRTQTVDELLDAGSKTRDLLQRCSTKCGRVPVFQVFCPFGTWHVLAQVRPHELVANHDGDRISRRISNRRPATTVTTVLPSGSERSITGIAANVRLLFYSRVLLSTFGLQPSSRPYELRWYTKLGRCHLAASLLPGRPRNTTQCLLSTISTCWPCPARRAPLQPKPVRETHMNTQPCPVLPSSGARRV
ncbi:hypothetical protein VTK26DRAFT_6818 [Humicola hyalothermophila]